MKFRNMAGFSLSVYFVLAFLGVIQSPCVIAQDLKAFPSGIYESAGPMHFTNDDVVARTPAVRGQQGVLVRIDWNLCGEDMGCLFNAIQRNLDSAKERSLKVALAISDGNNVPDSVKSQCKTIGFLFRNRPSSMCVAWDDNYLTEKLKLINELGKRFDSHPALGYIYFTGACSTNGFEGHCRVDPDAYAAAGYTAKKLSTSYVTIMRRYLKAFPTTPVVFEVHSLLDDGGEVWNEVWESVSKTNRVGVAAWWCSERLSVKGRETIDVWPIVKSAAKHTFAVCQTVNNFTSKPYDFSDSSVGLSYGRAASWNQDDVTTAFNETMDWIEGLATHAGQQDKFSGFSVIEMWTRDLKNPVFQPRLTRFRSVGTQ